MLNQRGTGRHSPPTEPPASREKRQTSVSLFTQGNRTPTLRCTSDMGLPSHEVEVSRTGLPLPKFKEFIVGDPGRQVSKQWKGRTLEIGALVECAG